MQAGHGGHFLLHPWPTWAGFTNSTAYIRWGSSTYDVLTAQIADESP